MVRVSSTSPLPPGCTGGEDPRGTTRYKLYSKVQTVPGGQEGWPARYNHLRPNGSAHRNGKRPVFESPLGVTVRLASAWYWL